MSSTNEAMESWREREMPSINLSFAGTLHSFRVQSSSCEGAEVAQIRCLQQTPQLGFFGKEPDLAEDLAFGPQAHRRPGEMDPRNGTTPHYNRSNHGGSDQ